MSTQNIHFHYILNEHVYEIRQMNSKYLGAKPITISSVVIQRYTGLFINSLFVKKHDIKKILQQMTVKHPN